MSAEELFRSDEPYELFDSWFRDAEQSSEIEDETVMNLATCRENIPSSRIVLLKNYDERGFVFYTNYTSHKSEDLRANPHAALCFYWEGLKRQVRIAGSVEQVRPEESDTYFNSRERGKKIGAWTSKQSKPLISREQFSEEYAVVEKRFEGEESIPRPEFWGGWRVIPRTFEFWIEGKYRLHERRKFTRGVSGWESTLLYP